MARISERERGSPEFWLVFFRPKADRQWIRWLAWGRWKHVAAMGYVAESDHWLVVDPAFNMLQMRVIRSLGEAAATYADLSHEAGVMRVVPVWRSKVRFRGLFCCTTIVAHMLGSRSRALRPDRLWRDLLREGAEVLTHGRSQKHVQGPGRVGEPAAGTGT